MQLILTALLEKVTVLLEYLDLFSHFYTSNVALHLKLITLHQLFLGIVCLFQHIPLYFSLPIIQEIIPA